jgi:flagellar hook-associated protein 1 FlgK
VVVSGGAAAGDRFLVQPFRAAAADVAVVETDPRRVAAAAALGAVGDNRNALLLAGVASERILEGGAASAVSVNATLIARAGSAAQQADLAMQAQAAIKTDAEAAMAEVSGVNLDEEAANLLRYQQAYQAMAQVIGVADSLFQSLISALRR